MGAKTSVAESVGFVFMFETGASSMSVISSLQEKEREDDHSTLGAQEMSVCDVCNGRQDPHGGGLLCAQVGRYACRKR